MVRYLLIKCVLYLFNPIHPICLPPEDFEDIEQKCESLGTCEPSKFMPHDCIGSGWGMTKPKVRRLPENQRWGKMKIWKKSACLELGDVPLIMDDKIMCAGNSKKGESSVCHGDSGGPLACLHNGKMVLVGIVSYGPPGCPEYSGWPILRRPPNFTRVKYYVDWIRNYTVN